MDEKLNCHFYIGDRTTDQKVMNYGELGGFKKELKNTFFQKFYWQSGALSQIFKPYQFYIMTGEPFNISIWAILVLNKLMGKKIFLWSHGWYGDEGPFKSKIKKIFFKMSTGVLLYGNYAKNLMVERGFDQKKLHVIYNSLDYDRQKRIRCALQRTGIFYNHFKNEDPVVIFTGRLNKVKKLNLLIMAHDLLQREGVTLNVLILGDGEEKTYLEGLVKDYNLTCRYWFYGACYDEKKIAQFFYEAVVCVSPGNIGLTGIHSLTYGCPVITHNNFCEQMPEFEVIQEGITGSFFEQDNVDDLKTKIKQWVFTTDPKDRTRQCCSAVIDKHYNPTHQIEILKQIFYADFYTTD